jgi:PAT family beta-lactamase induction signal transducer AmpG
MSIFSPKFLLHLLLGFSSGVPFAVTLGTLQAWMTDAKVDLTTIGIFSLMRIPYSIKFLWAPLLDRYNISFNGKIFLGRRKGWIFLTQLLLILTISAMSLADPLSQPILLAALGLLVCFFSASQDIVIDALRRDVLEAKEIGLATSYYIAGYRVGAILFAGSLALILAEFYSWPKVYLIMALSLIVGMSATLLIHEAKENSTNTPKTLKEAVFEPLKDFFAKNQAFTILLFILFYKLGDNFASVMTLPFILVLGFTKSNYAEIVKLYGFIFTVSGGLLGGWLLWIFGILQAVSTLGFVMLAQAGADRQALIFVISFENLSSGMGTAAYASFMGALCNRQFSATQYALLSSFMGIPALVLNTPSGYLAKTLGWEHYFLLATVLALPGLLLLKKVASWEGEIVEQPSHRD